MIAFVPNGLASPRAHRSCGLALRCVVAAYAVAHPSSQAFCEDPKATERTNASSGRFGSIYCGPRCVQRVLREYHIDVDLIDLIREMQWPEVEKGASLDAIAAALERRGIATRGVRIDPHVEIGWTHPAVVYLESEGTAHYVVWLPPKRAGAAARVWDHDARYGDPPGLFDRLRAGPVLLTSDHPIPNSASVGTHVTMTLVSRTAKAMLPFLLAGLSFTVGWIVSRRLPPQ